MLTLVHIMYLLYLYFIAICLVCRNINEDKRKAEAHQVMFEIVNDIENCPVRAFSCLLLTTCFAS